MNLEQLRAMRTRLHLEEEIPDAALEAEDPPYFRPAADSVEYQYMMERRRALGGSLPRRIVRIRRPISLPLDSAFEEFDAGSHEQSVSTTMGFTRLLRNLARDENIGQRIVPIVPDEARTFGMDSLFRELKIYASQGQKYEPVDHALLLSYAESTKGQILEEGITEAGAMSSFIAAGTAYATRGVPMVPFYIFYSMFGFQRVGDLIWQAADARTRGFLLGATAGRTTLQGEGLQHQDGHSLLLASTVPACQAYDPAFAYEVSAIIKSGLERMYGDTPEDIFITLPSITRTNQCRRDQLASPLPKLLVVSINGHRAPPLMFTRHLYFLAPPIWLPAKRHQYCSIHMASALTSGRQLRIKRCVKTPCQQSDSIACTPQKNDRSHLLPNC